MADFNESDLLSALTPIKAYLDDIVVCGGWTLQIYRKYCVHLRVACASQGRSGSRVGAKPPWR